MPAEQAMIMDESMENLLRPFRKKWTPNALARLQALGIDPEQKLKPRYPRELQDEAIRVLAEEFFPREPMDVASRKVGEACIRVIEEWVLGRTLMRMLRLLPHQAALKRLPQMMRLGNNYLDIKVTDLGGKKYSLEFNELGKYPHYWLGLMGTSNQVVLGYKRATIELSGYDGHRGLVTCDLEPPP